MICDAILFILFFVFVLILLVENLYYNYKPLVRLKKKSNKSETHKIYTYKQGNQVHTISCIVTLFLPNSICIIIVCMLIYLIVLCASHFLRIIHSFWLDFHNHSTYTKYIYCCMSLLSQNYVIHSV